MTKIKLIFSLLIILLLTACSSMQVSNAKPTPTIVRLERSADQQTGNNQRDGKTGRSLDDEESATDTPSGDVTPEIQSSDIPNNKSSATPVASVEQTPEPVGQSSDCEQPEGCATPTPVITTSAMVEIISGALYLRQGPGINYPTAGAAKKGDKLNVLGTDSSHFWLQVITDDGPAWLSGKTVYSQLLNASIEELPVIQVATPNQGGKLNEASPVESTNPDASPELVKVSALSSTNSDNSSDKIIFMTGSGGELYSINVDGTGKKFLTGLEDSPTTFHGGVIDPVLSPDGRTVAFVRWDGAEFGALYTINVDGSNERTIVGDIRQPRSPAWSPDGTEIIVSFQHGGLRDPQEECLDLDLDDGIHLPEDVAEITKSKHGKNIEICFIRKENLQWALRRINVETGYFEDLLSEKYSITPAWNPRDKSQVIYKGNRNLVELDLNQNADRNLFNDPRDGGPIFSPDGTKIALTYKQHDHWEIHLLTLATGERKRLTKSSLLASPQHNSAAPTWSPDGQQIAFLTDRTGAWEIWVMNSDGSNQHSMFPADVQAQLNLRYDGMNERMLSWSP